jgi:phage baseplate assembly protein W
MKKEIFYSDFDAMFLMNPVSKDIPIRTNDAAVKASIRMLVLTNFYERLFHSEIGSPIRSLLFENMDDLFEIVTREAIAQLITNYEPRVDLIDVNVVPLQDDNRVKITIIFRIKNTIVPISFDIILTRTR